MYVAGPPEGAGEGTKLVIWAFSGGGSCLGRIYIRRLGLAIRQGLVIGRQVKRDI